MIGLNYRLLGHVFGQKRIRGAVWRLVRRGVQDALYGLSNALKAIVTDKVGTLRRVVGSGCQGSRGMFQADFRHGFFWKINRKSFIHAKYRDYKFVKYMRE